MVSAVTLVLLAMLVVAACNDNSGPFAPWMWSIQALTGCVRDHVRDEVLRNAANEPASLWKLYDMCALCGNTRENCAEMTQHAENCMRRAVQ